LFPQAIPRGSRAAMSGGAQRVDGLVLVFVTTTGAGTALANSATMLPAGALDLVHAIP